MKGKTHLIACALATGSIAAVASANDLIVNGDFSAPSQNSSWYYGNPDGPFFIGDVPGWTTGYGYTGVWAPNLGPDTFGSNPDAGGQDGWASPNGELSMMYQQITGVTLEAGDSFDLSGYIGNRADLGWEYDLGGSGWMSLVTTSGDVLATTGDVDAPSGDFELEDLTYAVGASNPYIGEGLLVELGNAYGSQASFADISLSSSSGNSTPGPTALAPFAIGLMGFLRRRR